MLGIAPRSRALLVLALPARAATTLNLKDADINTLITTVSEVTGKNFIVDERVKGKVTVISSRPMSSEAVYETFLAVLAVKGYAAVPAGAVIKIVQDNTARQEGGARKRLGRRLTRSPPKPRPAIAIETARKEKWWNITTENTRVSNSSSSSTDALIAKTAGPNEAAGEAGWELMRNDGRAGDRDRDRGGRGGGFRGGRGRRD